MAKKRPLFAIAFGLVLVAILLWGSTKSTVAPLVELSGPTMGTQYQLRMAGDSIADVQLQAELQRQVDQRLAEINRLMSTYDPESELSRFNQFESDEWFPVSEATARVVSQALKTASLTNGAFDPTVGPAVNLWGFGPAARPTSVPSDEQIAEVKATIGFQTVKARLKPTPALRKVNARTTIDLSAIAKGYGVDQVVELLQKSDISAAMVEIGGEIRVFGNKPSGQPWRIGIEKPDRTNRLVNRVVVLEEESLATSGDYRNFFELEGQIFSHTINPRTARPVEHQLATVTVSAKTCQQSDAYATSLLAMGPVEGPAWAETHNVTAYFVERLDDGSYREIWTGAWSDQSNQP